MKTLAVLIGLLLAFPAFAGSLAELLKSPTYVGKRVQVALLSGRTEGLSGKLIDSGDDYLVLDITNANTAAQSPAQSPKPNSNYFDKFDPPAYQPSTTPIVIPFSAILYVRLQGN